MPVAVGLQLLGVVLLWRVGIGSAASHDGKHKGPTMGASMHTQQTARQSALRDVLHEVWSPIAHMRQVLREDRVFARYEGAYMTYGAGWMIGYALLPIIATDKLNLSYEQIARSTHVAYLLALVACLYPAAIALDKFGAVRSTGISFFLLLFYPVGLIFARNETDLIIVSVCYGIAHAGASVGWMLGPVSLAPSPEKVPAYVAIHATLVGLRGAIFQFLGVALYRLTDSFTLPLVIASLAYAWSAWQMFALARVMPNKANGSKAGS
jgi:dolichol kinase